MRSSILPSLALFLLTACGAAGVRVAHPATTGTLVATEDTYINRVHERPYVSLTPAGDRAFMDTAVLVRLDGQAVCFDVTTRMVAVAQTREAVEDVLTLQPATVSLAYGTGTLTGPAITPRAITEAGAWDFEAIESEHVEPDGTAVIDSTYVNTVWALEGGGLVCFTHGGAIAPSVSTLRLRYSQSDYEPSFDFRIDAEGAPVSAWPPGAIVAPGYEVARY